MTATPSDQQPRVTLTRRHSLLSLSLALAFAGSASHSAFAQTAASMQDTMGVSQFDTIVVTASGFEQQIKEAPASISVITREQLEAKPFHNIGDALRDVEGMTVDRGGKSGGANISIRGMPSDYTLLMVDGKRINRTSSGLRPNGFGDVDSNFIPPMSAIDRIEVVRGPMSTLYGSDAMGGVINVITRKVAKEWMGQITVDGTLQGDNQFGNSYGSAFYLSGPLKDDLLGLSIRGGYYRKLGASGTYPATQAEYDSGQYLGDIAAFTGLSDTKQTNVGVRFALTPTRDHDILLDLDQNWQTFDNSNGELGTLNSSIAPNRTGGGYEPEAKFNRSRYTLTHLGRYGDMSSDTSLLYDTSETKGRTNPMSSPRRPTDGSPRKLQYDNWVFDTKLNMSLLDNTNNLTVGGQWRQQHFVDSLLESPLDLRQWQWALFAENEWRIQDNLALTLGMRYDQNQQFGGQWSPRAYLVWNATPQWTIKGGVSRGYKTPDINLMTDGIIGFRGQGTIPSLGNPDLTPETSTTSEIGVLFDNQEGLRGNLTFFHTNFKDKIDTENVPNCRAPGNNVPGCIDIGDWIARNGNPVPTFGRSININTAVIKGFELGGSVPLYKGVSFTGNYTYTHSEQTSGARQGLPLGSQPQHALNLGLNWDVNERTNTWIRGEYRAKQFNDIAWNGNRVYYSPYWLASIGGSYIVNDNLTFSLSVFNLFDKNFVNYGPPTLTAPAAGEAWTNSYREVIEGRRIWLSANITF